MKYNFDEIIDRHNTNSVKYDGCPIINPLLPPNGIPMWIADMDFACPQPVLDAMKARLDKRILGYSMPLDNEYYMAVINWMRRRHGWEFKRENIVYSSGVIAAMNVSVEKLTSPGDKIILHTPAYHPFNDAILKYGRTPLYSKLINTDGYYTMDYDDMEEKAKDPACTLMFLCSPHNPSGRVWKEDELRRAAEICFANNVTIVSDEIHGDLIRCGQKHIPLATLYPHDKRIITCTAPSKTFNLAGNQLANIIIEDEQMVFNWMISSACGNPNPLSIDACMAAYNECEDYVEELKLYLDDNFRLMEKRIKEELPRAKFRIPEGTYLGWIDVSAFGLNTQQLNERISKAGLFIEYDNEFVRDGDNHVRINVAAPRSVLNKALDILISQLQ
ncbi:MAG: MalY/PatB family protein [Oscillospiraceae bacterium]